jgi:hypothetical protein
MKNPRRLYKSVKSSVIERLRISAPARHDIAENQQPLLFGQHFKGLLGTSGFAHVPTFGSQNLM